MYHTYTVDVHSIFLVEELRRLWQGKYEQALPELTELMRGCDDRAGALPRLPAPRHRQGLRRRPLRRRAPCARGAASSGSGSSPERVERVVFLVAAPPADVAPRAAPRSLRPEADPRVRARGSATASNLRNLYLLTFADIRASSKQAWTDWKGQLLRELFERTAEFLETGADDPQRALELIERARRDAARRRRAAELQSLGVAEAKIATTSTTMPRRYFISHTPAPDRAPRAAWCSPTTGRSVLATAVREMRGGFSEFILCTRDVHGLYANVAGALTAHGINILGAQRLHDALGARARGLPRHDAAGRRGGAATAWERASSASLERVLAGEQRVADLLRARGRAGRPRPPRLAQARRGGRSSNEESDFYTIVDVTGERPARACCTT